MEEQEKEFRKASDIVEEALNKAVPMIPDWEEGDMLIDWVVVCYVTNPDPEKQSGYPMMFANGEMPDYRAMGLLAVGMEKLSD